MTTLLPLIAGLVGAIIGSAGTVAVVLIQAAAENKRHRRQMCVEAAIADLKGVLEHSDAKNVASLAQHVVFYEQLLDLIDRGDVNPDEVKRIAKQTHEAFHVISHWNKYTSEF